MRSARSPPIRLAYPTSSAAARRMGAGAPSTWSSHIGTRAAGHPRHRRTCGRDRRRRRRDRRQPGWETSPFDERAAVFLRAAELLAGPWREKLNAATMLGQSKTAQQAEIDAACELIDFWRFNVAFGRQLLADSRSARAASGTASTTGRSKASSSPSRRSTSPRSPATCRPPRADGQHRRLEAVADPDVRGIPTMRLLEAAGLPPGVINLVTVTARGVRCGTRRSAAGRHPLHRLDGDVPASVARGRREHRPLPHLPAAGRRDRRQGLRRRPPRRGPTCCAPR